MVAEQLRASLEQQHLQLLLSPRRWHFSQAEAKREEAELAQARPTVKTFGSRAAEALPVLCHF